MTLLVTGATGLLGNNVARLALARGRAVRCLVRPQSDPRPLRGLDVERVEGDVRDPPSVERAVAGAELVVHAAAKVSIGRTGMAAFREVNVGGTLAVAEACRARGARLVHVSSVDALPFGTRERPTAEEGGKGPVLEVPYMVSKREAEGVVLDQVQRGLDAVIVNPGYLLGPWDWKPSSGRLLVAVSRGAGLLAPPGGNDFCHVEDVAAGILAAAEGGRRGERYILSGEALTYREAFALFARVTGAPGPVATLPPRALSAAGRVGDLVGRLIGSEPALNSAAARAASLPHHFDSSKAREELGYASRPAEAAAADGWRWLREEGYV